MIGSDTYAFSGEEVYMENSSNVLFCVSATTEIILCTSEVSEFEMETPQSPGNFMWRLHVGKRCRYDDDDIMKLLDVDKNCEVVKQLPVMLGPDLICGEKHEISWGFRITSNFTENSRIDLVNFAGLFQMFWHCEVVKQLPVMFLDFFVHPWIFCVFCEFLLECSFICRKFLPYCSQKRHFSLFTS